MHSGSTSQSAIQALRYPISNSLQVAGRAISTLVLDTISSINIHLTCVPLTNSPSNSPTHTLKSLYRSDIAAMQRGLERLGYDVGGADGLPGFKTRRSIGDWQQKNGRAPTCFPDANLVSALK